MEPQAKVPGGAPAQRTVAIVGASQTPTKFGHRAVQAYLRQGWRVYPVNPRLVGQTIAGQPVVAQVGDIPGRLDRVALYVPAAVGETLLHDIAERGPGELWVNPGAESDALIALAEALGLSPIQACAIVDIGERP